MDKGFEELTVLGSEANDVPELVDAPFAINRWIIFGSLKILMSKFVSIKLPFSLLVVIAARAAEAAVATSTPGFGSFPNGGRELERVSIKGLPLER